MSDYFFDTSALVKHYRPEAGSVHVDAILSDAASQFQISSLTIVEFASTMQRLKSRGEISSDELPLLLERFTADIGDTLLVLRFPRNWARIARDLVLTHGIRTLDALQLATALQMKRSQPIFVAADEKLLAAAKANDLEILNPLTA